MLASLWRSLIQSHAARLLLWSLLLLTGTSIFACSYGPTGIGVVQVRAGDGEPPAGEHAIRVAIQVATPMTVQARQARLQANVHHFKVRLYNWNGSTITSQVGTAYNTASGTVSGMYFTNVIAGQYKVTVEAWGDAGETQLFNESGVAAESSNAVTVSTGGVSGGPLTVSLQLQHGIGDRIDTTLNVVNGRTAAVAGMAPDDAGSVSAIHGYNVTIAGVTSEFVWIPRFTAYQLITASTCGGNVRYGTADNLRPNGFWVSTAPASGTPGTAWVGETLGGFYVAKYEASRADATGTTAGTSSVASVRPGVVPWANVSWDDAATACAEFHPAAHLIRDDEWTALAIWAQINGIAVKGNNNNLADISTSPTFTDDPSHSGSLRALTGSSASPTLTSHDGTGSGVQDLNGNVAEWTASLSGQNTQFNWFLDEIASTLTIGTSTNNKVVGQSTGPDLRRFGIPSQGITADANFDNDAVLVPVSATNAKAVRGGTWADGNGAGLWYLNMTNARTTATDSIGFRPALRF